MLQDLHEIHMEDMHVIWTAQSTLRIDEVYEDMIHSLETLYAIVCATLTRSMKR